MMGGRRAVSQPWARINNNDLGGNKANNSSAFLRILNLKRREQPEPSIELYPWLERVSG